MSVLKQQLSRNINSPLSPQSDLKKHQQRLQLLQQQLKQQQQKHEQQKQEQKKLEQQRQIKETQLQQQQQRQQQQNQQQQQHKQQQQQQDISFDPSALRFDQLTCNTLNGVGDNRNTVHAFNTNSNTNTFITNDNNTFNTNNSNNAFNTNTDHNTFNASNNHNNIQSFTELSPVSMIDDQNENYMDVTFPEPGFTSKVSDATFELMNAIEKRNNVDNDHFMNTHTKNNTPNSFLSDVPSSPSLLRHHSSDMNMNTIDTSQCNNFDALQNYYKSVRVENFKSIDSSTTFVFDSNTSNSLTGVSGVPAHFLQCSPIKSSSVVLSPAPSSASSSSDTDIITSRDVNMSHDDVAMTSRDYDTYDNLDKEALLDISHWISELCRDDLPGEGEFF